MKRIIYRDEYRIDRSTNILLPNDNLDYPTKIFEEKRVIFVSQRHFDIIDDNCLLGGASYEGRRDAVTFITNYVKESPIPMHIKNKICMVPTKSPFEQDCTWISTHNYKKVEKTPRLYSNDIHTPLSRLWFKDGTYVDVPLPKDYLEQIMARGLHCMNVFADL